MLPTWEMLDLYPCSATCSLRPENQVLQPWNTGNHKSNFFVPLLRMPDSWTPGWGNTPDFHPWQLASNMWEILATWPLFVLPMKCKSMQKLHLVAWLCSTTNGNRLAWKFDDWLLSVEWFSNGSKTAYTDTQAQVEVPCLDLWRHTECVIDSVKIWIYSQREY